MSGRQSDYEEKLLTDLLAKYQSPGLVVWGEIEGAPGTYAKLLVKSDGTVKVEGVTTISGSVDISDDWTRQLGQVDIQRYLGSVIGVANPLHAQVVVSGAVIDPRSIRALISSDVVTVYGSQTQALLQRATTFDLIVQLRSGGAEIDPRSIRALVKSTDELYSVLRTDAGVAYDARQIRSLISTDVITVYGSQTQALLQRALTYDALVQLRAAGTEYGYKEIRWSIPREPAWINGLNQTAPGTTTDLVTKTVTAAKTGRIFGWQIIAPEANQFILNIGATAYRIGALSGAGVICVSLSNPMFDSIAAGTVINIRVATAGGAGTVYRADLLYDEA